jgi:hypothetical protein
MNTHEAQAVLRQHFKPYTAQNYQQLRSLIGGEHVSKISGPSGTEYHFEVYASLVNEDSNDIEVEGIVTEVKGRWWLPPSVEQSFVISPDGQKYSRCPGLLPDAEPASSPNGGPAEPPANPGVTGGPPSVS